MKSKFLIIINPYNSMTIELLYKLKYLKIQNNKAEK